MVLMALTVLPGGCASSAPHSADLRSGGTSSLESPGESLPAAAVERFLRLATRQDYAGMGMVFGTSAGALGVRDSAREVERRMYAIATLIRHDQAVVGEGTLVPGRGGEAVAFAVELVRGQSARTVPVVAVLGPGGRWYVEQVQLTALAGREQERLSPAFRVTHPSGSFQQLDQRSPGGFRV